MSANQNRTKHVAETIELVLRILQTYNPARQTMNQHAVEIIEGFRLPVSPRGRRVQQVSTDDEDSDTQNLAQKAGLSPEKTKTKVTTLETTALSAPLEPEGKEFVERCACEIYNNAALLRDFTDLLYAENPSLRPALKPLYSFYFYYVVFELPRESSFASFRSFLGYLNATQALPLLRIVWGGAEEAQERSLVSDLTSSLYKTAKSVKTQPSLNSDFKNILDRYFDTDHVAQYLTHGIITQHIQAALSYIQQLQMEFENVEEMQIVKKPTTQAEPFKLSTPKKKITEVAVAPSPERHPAPDKEMLTAKYADEMEKKHQELQKTAKKPTVPDPKYNKLAQPKEVAKAQKEAEAASQKPSAAAKSPDRQETLPQLSSSKERRPSAPEAAAAKTTAKTTQTPQPQSTTQPQPTQPPQRPIKANKAQILKENALLEKKLSAEAQQLKDFISGRKDSVEYETWKARMEARDQAEREAEVEIRKTELQNLKQKVSQIVKVRQEERVQQVQQGNLESLQLALEVMEQEEKAMEELRDKNAQAQKELQERLQKAKEEVLQEKQKATQQHKEELDALKEEAEQMKLGEKVERQHYIKQIKAMLEVQSARRAEFLAKKFDPSSYEDLGLFDQMSITELRERLQKMREYETELLERKRRDIEAQKQREEEALEEKRLRIEQMKAAIAATRTQQRLGGSVYDGIVDQVKKYTQGLIDEYKENAERQRAQTEERRQRVTQSKEETSAQVADLKSRLKQMRDKNSTGAFYGQTGSTSAGKTSSASTGNAKMAGTGTAGQSKSALEKTRPDQTKRIDPKFNAFERTQAEQKRTQMEAEFDQKRRERDELEKEDEMRRKTAVRIQKERRETKRVELARKDPFKAKLMHIDTE